MRRVLIFLWCCALTTGCKKPETPPSPPTPATPATPAAEESPGPMPLVRLLEFLIKSDGKTATQPADSNLPIGKDFAIRLSSEGPVRLYVVKSAPKQDSEVLFPPPGTADSRRPAGELRVPAADAWLRVAGLSPGAQTCLLISTRALSRADMKCPIRNSRRRGDDKAPPPVDEPPPDQPLPDPPGPDEPRGPITVSDTLTAIPLYFVSVR